MNWKEMKCTVDGKEVCTVKKTDGGVQIDCSDDGMKICKEFKGGCC